MPIYFTKRDGMLRLVTLLSLFIFPCISMAINSDSLYQVDIIVFTHQMDPGVNSEELTTPVLSPDTNHAIRLGDLSSETSHIEPFKLLPSSNFNLKQEYWALTHNPRYKVIARYSWLQPEFNKRSVVLPKSSGREWNIEGTIQAKHNNYYIFDSELTFTSTTKKQNPFIFSHSQRIKNDVVYYFDHPVAGMLVKIHQIG